MLIKEIKTDKKKYIDLLLIADEQESMIDKYINRGKMFALFDNDLKTLCIVTKESDDTIEIKNIVTVPMYQKNGYGKKLIDFLCKLYKQEYSYMIVGTGDSDLTIPFYEKCGFKRFHIVKNFFLDNYDKEIFENGKQLIDMIYLKKKI